MKKVIVLIAISLLNIGSSFAGSDPELKEEITQKMQIDLSGIALDMYGEDFVHVEFKIYDGLVKIVSVKASQPELKELVMEKLNEIHIKTPYSETEVHNFNFTFKKQ